MSDTAATQHTPLDTHTFGMLQARCNLLDYTLIRHDNGNGHEVFTIAKWAFSRELRTLGELLRFVAAIEGRRHG